MPRLVCAVVVLSWCRQARLSCGSRALFPAERANAPALRRLLQLHITILTHACPGSGLLIASTCTIHLVGPPGPYRLMIQAKCVSGIEDTARRQKLVYPLAKLRKLPLVAKAKLYDRVILVANQPHQAGTRITVLTLCSFHNCLGS